MDVLWNEKYRPETLDELYLPLDKINIIKNWLSNYHITKKALLLIGPPGVGKTSLARIIFSEYKIIEYNASDIRTQALISKAIGDVIDLNNIGAKKRGVIMDEVDGMIAMDKKGLEELISFIKPKKKKSQTSTKKNGVHKMKDDYEITPFILITNIGKMKQTMLQTLCKNCIEIFFDEPLKEDFINFIKKIWLAEFNEADLNELLLEELYQIGQNDYRRILNFMEFLSFSGLQINEQNIQKLKKIYFSKSKDVHIISALEKTINEPRHNYSKIMNIYHNDKNKAPLIVYENYIKYAGSINVTNLIIKCVCISDIIEKIMYTSQTWHLLTTHGIFALFLPLNLFNKRPVKLMWTDILSISSCLQNNKKKILYVAENIKYASLYSYNDIQLFAEMVLYLICKKKYNEAVSIMNYYVFYEIDILSAITCASYFKDYFSKIINKDELAIISNLIAQAKAPAHAYDHVQAKTTITAITPINILQPKKIICIKKPDCSKINTKEVPISISIKEPVFKTTRKLKIIKKIDE